MTNTCIQLEVLKVRPLVVRLWSQFYSDSKNQFHSKQCMEGRLKKDMALRLFMLNSAEHEIFPVHKC